MIATCLLALPALVAPLQEPERTAPPLPVLLLWTQPYLEAREEQAAHLLPRLKRYAEMNHHADRVPRIYTSQFGSEDTMYWFASSESLQSALAYERSTATDEGWRALHTELAQLLVEGAGRSSYLFPLGGGATPDDLPKMYRWVRVAHTFSPKVAEARRFAKDLADYLEASYPEIDASAYSPDLQAPETIFWFVDYDSLSAWESVRAELLADDAYLELMARAGGLFVEEDVRETLLLDSDFDPLRSDHFSVAIHLKDRGDFEGALAEFRRAVELDPRDVVAMNWVGVCLGKLGDHEGKIATFRRVLEIDPEYEWSLLNLGTDLAKEGELDEAVELYSRCIAVHPAFMAEHFAADHPSDAAPRCAFVEALARWRLDDREGARAAYDRALVRMSEIEPEPYLLTLRAKVEAALGLAK